MTTLQEPAWAKLNLALDVGALRPDGYHEMRMLMQTVSLHDTVTLHLDAGRWWADGGDDLPHDERNLALKAARLFCEAAGYVTSGVEVLLEKRIPSCAGLGGGSADAAAVLRALQRHLGSPLREEQLLELAGQIGSDVPFCLVGGTALAEGRGERLTKLSPLPMYDIVLCKPSFASPTPALFHALDQEPPTKRPDMDTLMSTMEHLDAFGAGMWNVFEPLLTIRHPELAKIRETLLANGAVGAMLTGTGSAMFGLFTDSEAADRAQYALAQLVPWVTRAVPVNHV